MTRKIIFTLIMFFFLIGCTENPTVESDNHSENIPVEDSSETNNIENNQTDNMETEPLLHLEPIGESLRLLQLIDLSTDEQISCFELDLGIPAAFGDIVTINNSNYFAVEVIVESEDVEFFLDENGEIVGWSQAGMPSLYYMIFDTSLQVVYDVTFSDEGPSFNNGLSWKVIDDSFAVVFQEGNDILIYDVLTETSEMLFTALEGIFIQETGWISENKLFFIATMLGDETNQHYGVIDLETRQMDILLSSDFDTVAFDFSSPYLLLQEHGAALFTGGELQNEVIFLNVITGSYEAISLGNLESLHAVLSLDGQYIIAANDTHTFLRKYHIETHELVNEIPISPEAGYNSWAPRIIPIDFSAFRLVWTSDDTETNVSEMVFFE